MPKLSVLYVGGELCGLHSCWQSYQHGDSYDTARPLLNGYGFLPSPMVAWMVSRGRAFPAEVRVYSSSHPMFRDEVDRLRLLRKVDMLGVLGCFKRWGVLPVLRELDVYDVLDELQLLIERGYRDNGTLRRMIGEVRHYLTDAPHLLVKGFCYEDPQE